jgi:glycosyltransferase involved in cell wall biosynthesis
LLQGSTTSILVLDFVPGIGGMERVVWNVLSELGREITVYYVDALANRATRERLSDRNVRILSMSVWPSISELGLSQSRVRRLWIPLVVGPSYLFLSIRLLAFARRNRVSVCWTNTIKGLAVLQMTRVLGGPPVLFYAHGLPDLSPWEVRLINHASAIIAVSEAVRSGLIDHGVNGGKVRVIPNGVDVDKMRDKDSLSSAASRPDNQLTYHGEPAMSILLAGRLVPIKGIDTAIRAIGELHTRGINVELRVAGCAPGGNDAYSISLRELARAVRAQDKICWLGWRDDVYDLMVASDVVIMPSRGPEGFGMSALEAMALGRPVIVSNVGGLAELVSDGISGLLVPPNDASSLANALETLADPELRRTIGTNAEDLVRTEFTLEKQVGRIMDTIVLLAGGCHVTPSAPAQEKNSV